MSLGASGWIKLNVGGQPFLTTLTTILSCPESTLSKMFDPDSGFEPLYQENGVYFLDANPKYFSVILDWMRQRKILSDSEIILDNVAQVADYFGLLELVEEIKKSQEPVPLPITGQWMKYQDIPLQNRVSAMTLPTIIPNEYQVSIVQSSGAGLRLSPYEGENEKHLSVDLKGRKALWVQTTTGQIPAEAVSVKGEGGRRMFIGRRMWIVDGTQNAVTIQVLHTEDYERDNILPAQAHISVGYVNENGIWSINFSKSVYDIAAEYRYDPTLFMADNPFGMKNLQSSSEFEILCIF